MKGDQICRMEAMETRREGEETRPRGEEEKRKGEQEEENCKRRAKDEEFLL
jgi:hypothetical protein